MNSNLIKALFLFIFILLGKHISELLACSISNIIKEHFYVKHIIGFFILYFTIVSFDNTSNLLKLFGTTFILYIWFIIITRTTRRINISLIIIIVISYIIHLYNEQLKKKEDKTTVEIERIKMLNIYEEYIVYLVAFLSIFGFIIYIGEKKLDYEDAFDWNKFLIGDFRCNNTKSKTINKLNYFERASVAFMNPTELKTFIHKINK
tara:strand:+ start:784 stop:1401 length:618 start_codon:yes stop_codon:yes gene_type:complete